jgi:hypothetical protein
MQLGNDEKSLEDVFLELTGDNSASVTAGDLEKEDDINKTDTDNEEVTDNDSDI